MIYERAVTSLNDESARNARRSLLSHAPNEARGEIIERRAGERVRPDVRDHVGVRPIPR